MKIKMMLAASLATGLAGAPLAAAPAPSAFGVCAACHAVKPGAHSGIGPSLFGVAGRKAGSQAGFAYSPAMKNSGLTWTAANLDSFIANPRKLVPGTRMPFGGLGDAGARAAIVAYLATLK